MSAVAVSAEWSASSDAPLNSTHRPLQQRGSACVGNNRTEQTSRARQYLTTSKP
jgi:hypothetical protein